MRAEVGRGVGKWLSSNRGGNGNVILATACNLASVASSTIRANITSVCAGSSFIISNPRICTTTLVVPVQPTIHMHHQTTAGDKQLRSNYKSRPRPRQQ